MSDFLFLATRNIDRFSALRYRSQVSYYFYTWRGHHLSNAGTIVGSEHCEHSKLGAHSLVSNSAETAARQLLKSLGKLLHHQKATAFSKWHYVCSRMQNMEALLKATRLIFNRALPAEQILRNSFGRFLKGISLFRTERSITIVSIMAHRRRKRNTARSFFDWVKYVTRCRLVRSTMLRLVDVHIRIALRQRWQRWHDFTRRTGVWVRRRLRDAMALYAQNCQLRVIRAWRIHLREIGYNRLRAVLHWRNQNALRYFSAWSNSVINIKSVRAKRRAVLVSIAKAWSQRRLFQAWYTWLDLSPKKVTLHPTLESRIKDADDMRRVHNTDTMRVSSLWRNYHSPLQDYVCQAIPITSADAPQRSSEAFIMRYRAERAREVAREVAAFAMDARRRETIGVDDYFALQPPPPPRKVGEYTWEYYQYLRKQDDGKATIEAHSQRQSNLPSQNAKTPSRQ